jgi:hypothetical protein
VSALPPLRWTGRNEPLVTDGLWPTPDAKRRGPNVGIEFDSGPAEFGGLLCNLDPPSGPGRRQGKADPLQSLATVGFQELYPSFDALRDLRHHLLRFSADIPGAVRKQSRRVVHLYAGS